MSKRREMAPEAPRPSSKDGPLWTVGILAAAGVVTLLILMLATGH
jgi:hypothetical protein